MRDSATSRGLNHDAIKLLKTQDAGYLRTVGERVRREMEKVKEEVRVQEGIRGVLGGGESEGDEEEDDEDDWDGFGAMEKKPKKLVFADDRDSQKALKRTLQEEEDKEDEEDGDDSFGARVREQQKKKQKTRKELEAEKQALNDARRARKLKKRADETRKNKLKALEKQFADITAAERALDLQRAKMSNSIGGVNKNGMKFKIKERKR
jgi:U3 small nucleolar RNA-associated protein 11